MRRAEREEGIYSDELTGAQKAKADAQAAKSKAISGAIGSLGSAAGSFSGLIGEGGYGDTPTDQTTNE
jgi:hypothetical protein